MLELTCGNIREGKTIFLMYQAWKLHNWNMAVSEKHRLPIYTNFEIRYPEAHKVEVSELLDLEGISAGFMPVQELYGWLESRVSSSNLSKYVSYFIFQSGKRGVGVHGDAQLGSSVDLRFWDLAHIIGQVHRDDFNQKFCYDFAVRCGRGVRLAHRDLPFVEARKFWNDYNTAEPAVPVGLKQLQFEMDKLNAPKINARVDAIVNKWLLTDKDDGSAYFVNGVPYRFIDVRARNGWRDEKCVYRYQVEDLLLRMGEPLPLAPMVTNRLKVTLRL
jgi:hypothetical protein